VILGLLVAVQLFISEELLLLTALACGVAVVVTAASEWRTIRSRLRPLLGALGVTALVAGALTAYPIWFQFFGPQAARAMNAPIFYRWGEDLASFVSFSRDTLAGSAEIEQTLGRTEQNSWFGWPLCALLVAIAPALWRRSRAARTATIVALV